MENNTKIYKVLTVLFIALKLDGVISWSWVLVISPILIQGGITLFCKLLWCINWVYHSLHIKYLKYLCNKIDFTVLNTTLEELQRDIKKGDYI